MELHAFILILVYIFLYLFFSIVAMIFDIPNIIQCEVFIMNNVCIFNAKIDANNFRLQLSNQIYCLPIKFYILPNYIQTDINYVLSIHVFYCFK